MKLLPDPQTPSTVQYNSTTVQVQLDLDVMHSVYTHTHTHTDTHTDAHREEEKTDVNTDDVPGQRGQRCRRC